MWFVYSIQMTILVQYKWRFLSNTFIPSQAFRLQPHLWWSWTRQLHISLDETNNWNIRSNVGKCGLCFMISNRIMPKAFLKIKLLQKFLAVRFWDLDLSLFVFFVYHFLIFFLSNNGMYRLIIGDNHNSLIFMPLFSYPN